MRSVQFGKELFRGYGFVKAVAASARLALCLELVMGFLNLRRGLCCCYKAAVGGDVVSKP